jgi:hypothetical protein
VFAGDPARGIAPCSACHGPGGYKLGAPALQQQRTPYIERQLGAFAEGLRQNDISEQMRTVAKELTPEEMNAVAAFYGAQGSNRRVPGGSPPHIIPVSDFSRASLTTIKAAGIERDLSIGGTRA